MPPLNQTSVRVNLVDLYPNEESERERLTLKEDTKEVQILPLKLCLHDKSIRKGVGRPVLENIDLFSRPLMICQ